jgi:3-oxoacyl-[acyl-carrier-protein] synthase-3
MPWKAWDFLFGRGGEPPTPEEKAVVTRFRDRTVLFGDAGGAVVLRAGEGERGILGFQLHSDGANFKDLYVPGVGFAHRPFVDEEQVREWGHVPEMNGRAVFKLAVSRMPQAVRELCASLAVGLALPPCPLGARWYSELRAVSPTRSTGSNFEQVDASR